MAAHRSPAPDGGRAVIVLGSTISEPDPYLAYARPGIDRVMEGDSLVLAFSAVGPIARGYNLLLEEAAKQDDLEALVLVHPHLEITDPSFLARVREALADPQVAVVGAQGSRGTRSLAWWEGETAASRSATIAYGEAGGGELPVMAWGAPAPAPAAVDVVDGWLMVLSPWAVEHLRFDEALSAGHGYDVDFCLQARAAGREVLVAELGARYHRDLELVGDYDLWMEAHQKLAAKWEAATMPEDPEDEAWHRRARRAEAEREAVRAMVYSQALVSDARVLELEAELRAVEASPGWKLTKPLREANRLRRVVEERRAAGDADGAAWRAWGR